MMNLNFNVGMATRILAVVFIVGWTPNCIAQDLTPEQAAFFESKIRPVLIKECFGCHSDKTGKIRGGLRLDTRQLMLVGGESGPVIVPGKPNESLLLKSMIHDGLAMPPKRRLSNKVIEDFRLWIEMGAPDPRKTAAATVQSTVSQADVERARQTFWAYQPVVSPVVPGVELVEWPRSKIDQFILAKLEQADLTPAEDDQPYRILRRLSFDLVGLPPTQEQLAYFEKAWAKDPDRAISKVVDYFLMQPQFGEHWGRHWLDVARYAESTGFAVNLTFPHAWRYRDYVIDSFNKDKPYDKFVKEQIAGDLLPAKTDETWAEQLVATSFLAIGAKNINEMNSLQFRADQVDEQVDATSRVFLGMSLACARCHDHKFDAIPQADYYAMAGFFESTNTFFGSQAKSKNPMVQQDSGILEYPLNAPGPGQKAYDADELKQLKEQIETIRSELGGRSFASIQKRIYIGQLENELEGLDSSGNPISYCMGVQCADAPRDATLLIHGEVDQRGDVIPRGFPSVLSNRRPRIKAGTSGRKQLAEWIVDRDNPLTARVMVNRIWLNLIGQGIVASPNDFGATGQPPSHPELLDFLTSRFIESGWSIKSLVRDIATSRIYRMRSDMNKDAFEFDPANSLLWRAHPRRLSAEAIRDNMLAVSGELDLKRPHGSEIAIAGFVRVRNGVLEDLAQGIGGFAGRGRTGGMTMSGGGMGPRNVRGPKSSGNGTQSGRSIGPAGRMGNRRVGMQSNSQTETVQSEPPGRLDMVDAKFRSVYLPHVRNETPRCLDVFDAADSNTSVGKRVVSDTADQALYLLNNQFVLAQAEAFANRLKQEAVSEKERIRLAFLLAYGRQPQRFEQQAAIEFLNDLKSTGNGLVLLCQSLFASAEFRYVY